MSAACTFISLVLTVASSLASPRGSGLAFVGSNHPRLPPVSEGTLVHPNIPVKHAYGEAEGNIPPYDDLFGIKHTQNMQKHIDDEGPSCKQPQAVFKYRNRIEKANKLSGIKWDVDDKTAWDKYYEASHDQFVKWNKNNNFPKEFKDSFYDFVAIGDSIRLRKIPAQTNQVSDHAAMMSDDEFSREIHDNHAVKYLGLLWIQDGKVDMWSNQGDPLFYSPASMHHIFGEHWELSEFDFKGCNELCRITHGTRGGSEPIFTDDGCEGFKINDVFTPPMWLVITIAMLCMSCCAFVFGCIAGLAFHRLRSVKTLQVNNDASFF